MWTLVFDGAAARSPRDLRLDEPAHALLLPAWRSRAGYADGTWSRWLRAVVVVCGLVAAILWSPGTSAQNPDQPIGFPAEVPKPDREADVQTRALLQLIRDIDTSIAEQNWGQAVSQFDSGWKLVCTGEDPLLIPAAGDVNQLVAGRNEVNAGGRARLEIAYENAPEAFRREYQRQYAASADQSLAAAIKSGLIDELKFVSARYRFLPAAEQAARLTARIAIDRSDFLEATLQLEKLRRLSGDTGTELRLQTALAAWRAGLAADAVDNLRSLAAAFPSGTVRFGKDTVTLPDQNADLQAWLQKLAGGSSQSPVPQAAGTATDATTTRSDWIQPLGNFRRTESRRQKYASFEPAWSSDLFSVTDILFQDKMNPVLGEARRRIQLAMSRGLEENSTLLPVPSPLMIGELLIFRTATGVRAVDQQTGDLVWETTHPDGRLRSLAEARDRGDERGPFSAQLLASEMFVQLTRTNTAGQLSSNGKTLFVVEDSAWVTWNSDPDFRPSVASRLPANYLRAYDVNTGVFRWEAGGQRSIGPKSNLLAGFYFLGTPLVFGSRIYVMAENSEGIYLLQIGEPEFNESGTQTTSAGSAGVNPRILHSQLLASPQFTLRQHPVRKHAGLTPSYSQGLLICPTCDEHVVAVSAEDHSVRWVYRYTGTVRVPDLGNENPLLAGAHNESHSVSVDLNSRWTDALPRIVGSRILLSSRDSDELICLDLQSGREMWRSPRGLSRTIGAVRADVVVLLGNKVVTVLRISDGSLLWTNEIRDGHVTGQPTFDDTVIRIPTSAQSLIAFEIENGRQVLTQHFPGDEPPGNLIISGSRIFSQTHTTLVAIDAAEPPSKLNAAGQLLLAGDLNQAVPLLEEQLRQTDESESVQQRTREILVETLLELLRVDYTRASQHIPRLRELIQQSNISESQLLETLFTMLGMNLSDAAMLPGQIDQLDRPGQQMDQLFELIVRGLNDDRNLPVPELAASVAKLLPEFSVARTRLVRSGDIHRRNSRLLASAIRRVLHSRSVEDQHALQAALREPAIALLSQPEITAPEITRLIRDLAAAGLANPARQIAESVASADRSAESEATASARQTAPLLIEQLLLDAIRSSTAEATAATTALLDRWDSSGDESAVRAFLRDVTASGADNPLAVLQYQNQQPDSMTPAINQWLDQHPHYRIPVTSPWTGKPVITVSDDRSVLPAGQPLTAGPRSLLPIFGMQGIYRGWSFVQETESAGVVAIDRQGARRWSFEPPMSISPQQSGLVTEKYVLVHGHLVAIKLSHMLFVLDTSTATPVIAPRLLWQTDVEALHRDRDAAMLRRIVPGWERVLNYAPQPVGLFPTGPLTSLALPVISGRRLFVFDPVTGDQNWMVDGLPPDAVLLGTDDVLLILSESARQIEVRHLIDGERTAIARVPDWWMDANENVGSSVRDIEVEPGLDLLWRVAISGKSCVLFRLSSGEAALECRDLLTDQVTWSVKLPQDSVFSNVAEDMVAVLSNGNELRVFRIDSGTELANHQVTAAPASRELYFRPSLNRLLVLPESAADPASLDLDPVISGLHVNGRLYAIDRATMALAWDRPLDHRHLRILNAPEGPTIPNAPILVLLNRYRKPRDDNSGSISSRYAAEVIDVATGEDLYFGQDVGRTLNYHWLVVDAASQRLQLGFENNIVTFDYRPDDAPAK